MPKPVAKGPDYPYPILPLKPVLKSYRRVPPAMVNLYFQIEALLRSEKAAHAYRHGRKTFQSFLQQYEISCDPLAGEHHALMQADYDSEHANDDLARAGFIRNPKTGSVEDDILDLQTVIHLGPSPWWPKGGATELLHALQAPRPRFIHVRLDVSKTASALIQALRPFLKARHKEFLHSPVPDPLEQRHRQNMKPAFRDVSAWIKYFQCYDLRRREQLSYGLIARSEQLSYGLIARKIYGAQRARDKAEKAILRVERVIADAVANNWPPRNPSR